MGVDGYLRQINIKIGLCEGVIWYLYIYLFALTWIIIICISNNSEILELLSSFLSYAYLQIFFIIVKALFQSVGVFYSVDAFKCLLKLVVV